MEYSNNINNILTLLDEEFLIELQSQQNRELFARVISLDFNENPLDSIEGKVTGGTINLDGSSSVRRTCSLTLVSQEVNIKDYYWGLRTKFKLEIGLKNHLLGKYSSNYYPDLVWFPMGTYILTTFGTSLSPNSCTISLSGKDKMCMLNGDLGGQLFASIDFGQEEVKEKKFTKIDFTDPTQFQTQKYYVYDSTIEVNNPTADGRWLDSKQQELLKYKLLKTPSELFKFIGELNNNNYKQSKYYYKLYGNTSDGTNEIYVIDDTSQVTNGRKYYQLRTDICVLDYEYTIKKIPLEKIILEGVHAHAKEPYENIIIQDLDSYGLEQLTYKGDKTLYLFRRLDTGHFVNGTIQANKEVWIEENNNPIKLSLSQLDDYNNFEFDHLMDEQTTGTGTPVALVQGGGYDYSIVKATYGLDIGYRITDLTYTGDLITNIGESLASMLDKIKNMLGDFEYFYDLNGRFVFRRKPVYVNTSWSLINQTDDEKWVDYANSQKKCVYNFEGNKLFTALNNSPNIAGVRNDFIVWGKRKSVSGQSLPIHARYAIDKKPRVYRSLNHIVYYDPELITAAEAANLLKLGSLEVDQNKKVTKVKEVDWREVLYQMALDFFRVGHQHNENDVTGVDENGIKIDPDQFLAKVAANNGYLYPTGYTGYEQYYTDMEGFWRQLYNPNAEPIIEYTEGYYEKYYETNEQQGLYTRKERWVDQKPDNIIIQYYISEDKATELKQVLFKDNIEALNTINHYTANGEKEDRFGWNVNIWEAPDTLNFWIEFFDDASELAQFSVSVIGDRTKVVNNDKVTAIFYKEVPDIILSSNYADANSDWTSIKQRRSELMEQTGYTFLYLPKGMESLFTISYRGLSAKNAIDQLVFENAYMAENITITALPVYNLDVNSRIYVEDSNTGVNGEYMVNKVTLPLVYNGTMSITAVKAPERLY